jgi:hypothetical protein
MLAVKLTVPPEQMVVELELIVTVGVTKAFTVMAIEFEVATEGLAQAAFDVSTHDTTSPWFRAAEEKVEELVPTVTPFTRQL